MAKMERPTIRGSSQAGVAYLALLMVIAIMGGALAAVGTIWSTVEQRDKERELLFVGNQYRRAIMQYYESSPGDKKYPSRLDDLLSDSRFLGERRHLRQVYRDPMTNSTEWGIVRSPLGGIMGVHSQSTESALKRGSFPSQYRAFEEKQSYSEWKFEYVPPEQTGTTSIK